MDLPWRWTKPPPLAVGPRRWYTRPVHQSALPGVLSVICKRIAAIAIIVVTVTAGRTCAQQSHSHFDRPYVFSSSQLKYGLYQNYLHRYMDRPLFMDTSLRENAVVTCPSFQRIMDHAMMYEMDGLGAIIGGSGMIQRYEIAMDCAEQQHPEGFMFFPIFGGDAQTDYKSRTIEIAKASSITARFDYRGGELMRFGTYGGDRTPPEELAEMLGTLRAEHGDFIYLIAITRWSDAHEEFLADGNVSAGTDAAMRAHIREYLDIADGIDMTYGGAWRRPDRTFDAEFDRGYVIPTLRAVLSEPPYRDKFLALGAKIGYFQFMSGSTLDEDGTRTLRASFEAAMDARPDMIGLAEWDELNEHTTIEPTVCNSLSTQRIIRHYMRRLKGLQPASNPGDNTSIPNLIVSYRRKLTLGEQVEIEMLNVPDGSDAQYTVLPSLADEEGSIVCDAAPVTFDAGELAEHRWTIPGETLAGRMVLRPGFAISTPDGQDLSYRDGLHHITLRPTDNWDYKWVKQPLRDLIPEPQATFTMAPTHGPGGSHAITASFACDEPLASLEVLENDDEVYAVDVTDEYPDRDEYMLLRVDIRSYERHEFVGRMWIDGAEAQFHTETDGRYFFNEGNGVRANMWLGQWRRVFFASIPRGQALEGTLHLDFSVLQGEMPLSRLQTEGLYSRHFEPDLQVTLEDFDRAPDLPPHIGAPEASLAFNITPRRPHSVFHLRAITVSGKSWRSAPVMIAGVAEQPPVALDVFSDTLGEAVEVQVAESAIPDLDYRLLPENGSLVWTEAGVPFCGQIGGRANAVTYVGGGESGGMGNPFRNGAAYPSDAPSTAPEWVVEDGTDALRFDGIGNFIVFPREVTPRRGAWTLQMQIKPTSTKKQILWRHHGHYIGSVTVYLEDGELWSTYTDDQVNSTTQRSGLTLPMDQWSDVTISHNLDTIVFRVNGQTSAPQAAPGPGMYIGTSVFGGHGAGTEYFEGHLRSLRMLHRATLQ